MLFFCAGNHDDIKELSSYTMFTDGKTLGKMAVVTSLIYRFNTVPMKNLVTFLIDVDKPVLKSVWKVKKKNSQNTFEKA